MEITTTINGAAASMKIDGRLDTSTAPQLEAAISEIIEDITSLDLDFSELEYLSSAGLRVLLSTHKTMAKKGSMTLHNVNETIMEIFEMTGFADFLVIE